jgi:hypothetical protein
MNTTIRLDIVFLGDNKQKKLVKVKKYSDEDRFSLKKDIKVIVNESIWDLISEDKSVIEILVREEFNSIVVDMESGKIKIEKPKFNTSKALIEKYSYDGVSRAKQLEEDALSQATDKAQDLVDISA